MALSLLQATNHIMFALNTIHSLLLIFLGNEDTNNPGHDGEEYSVLQKLTVTLQTKKKSENFT
jgi:hypothetical protein